MKEYPKYSKQKDAGVNLWAAYLAELRIGLNVASMTLWAEVNNGSSMFPPGSPIYRDYKEFIGLFYGWFNTTKNYLNSMYGEEYQKRANELRDELNKTFQDNFRLLSKAVRKSAVVDILNKHASYNDLIDNSPLQKIIEEAVVVTDQG